MERVAPIRLVNWVTQPARRVENVWVFEVARASVHRPVMKAQRDLRRLFFSNFARHILVLFNRWYGKESTHIIFALDSENHGAFGGTNSWVEYRDWRVQTQAFFDACI